MKLTIDTDKRELILEEDGKKSTLGLYTREAFELLSREWLKVGWDQKYTYGFSWMGRPVIQLPEDMIRMQEVIYRVKPDVIIETGVAHGGSLIFYASICKAMGRGRVIGIDVEIREHNRRAIEAHELFSYLTLIVGDSVDGDVVARVKSCIRAGAKTLVILDSCHTKDHVLKELEVYAPFVTQDSYIVATDGIMKDLSDVPRGKPEWLKDNPTEAAIEFLKKHPEFILEPPAWPFKENELKADVTHWPGAWLKRKK